MGDGEDRSALTEPHTPPPLPDNPMPFRGRIVERVAELPVPTGTE